MKLDKTIINFYLSAYDFHKIILFLIPTFCIVLIINDYEIGFLYMSLFLGLSVPLLLQNNDRGSLPTPFHQLLLIAPQKRSKFILHWYISYFIGSSIIIFCLLIGILGIYSINSNQFFPPAVIPFLISVLLGLFLIFSIIAPTIIFDTMKTISKYILKAIAIVLGLFILPILHVTLYERELFSYIILLIFFTFIGLLVVHFATYRKWKKTTTVFHEA